MLKQNIVLHYSNLHNFALYTVLNKQYFKFVGHFKEFESIRTTPYLRLTLFQNVPPEDYKCANMKRKKNKRVGTIKLNTSGTQRSGPVARGFTHCMKYDKSRR